MSDFFWFSDAQWDRIAPLLPTDVHDKARVDDRRVLSGIVHALRCGGRWADCADVYGPKKTLYNRFVRWAERGVWEGIFSALAGAEGHRIDCSSTVAVSRSIAAQAAEKGGLGSWYRPHQRRAQHQDPCHLRCQGPPSCPDADAGKRPRLQGCQNLHRRTAMIGRTRRRQGFRQPGFARMAGRAGHSGRHPAASQPQDSVRLRPHRLQTAQRHRTHVLPPQGLETHRQSLRPKHQKLHGRHRTRCSRHLVVMSPDPRRRGQI